MEGGHWNSEEDGEAHLIPSTGSRWGHQQRSVHFLPLPLFPLETITILKSRSSKNDAQAWAKIIPRDWRDWLHGRCTLDTLWAWVGYLGVYYLQVKLWWPHAPLYFMLLHSSSCFCGNTRLRLLDALIVGGWSWVGRLWGFLRWVLRWGDQRENLKVRKKGSKARGWDVGTQIKWPEFVKIKSRIQHCMQSGSGRAIQTKAMKATRMCWRLPFMLCGQESGSLWMASEPHNDGHFHCIPCKWLGLILFPKIRWAPTCTSHNHFSLTSLKNPYSFLHTCFPGSGSTIHLLSQVGICHLLAVCHLLLSLCSLLNILWKPSPSLSALWLPVLVCLPWGTRSFWLGFLSWRSTFHVVTFLCPNLKHVSSSSRMNPCCLLGDVQTLHETLLSCRSVWFCLSAVTHKHFPYTAPLKCTEYLLCVGSCAGRHSCVISLTPRTIWSICLPVLWLLPGAISLLSSYEFPPTIHVFWKRIHLHKLCIGLTGFEAWLFHLEAGLPCAYYVAFQCLSFLIYMNSDSPYLVIEPNTYYQ